MHVGILVQFMSNRQKGKWDWFEKQISLSRQGGVNITNKSPKTTMKGLDFLIQYSLREWECRGGCDHPQELSSHRGICCTIHLPRVAWLSGNINQRGQKNFPTHLFWKPPSPPGARPAPWTQGKTASHTPPLSAQHNPTTPHLLVTHIPAHTSAGSLSPYQRPGQFPPNREATTPSFTSCPALAHPANSNCPSSPQPTTAHTAGRRLLHPAEARPASWTPEDPRPDQRPYTLPGHKLGWQPPDGSEAIQVIRGPDPNLGTIGTCTYNLLLAQRNITCVDVDTSLELWFSTWGS